MTAVYQVLKEIERNPAHSQRTLAHTLDISVGKANYLLAGLVGKGIVKVRRLTREPGTIRWRYILTPKGLREKARITADYLQQRLDEYDRLKVEIAELRREVGDQR